VVLFKVHEEKGSKIFLVVKVCNCQYIWRKIWYAMIYSFS